MNTDSGTPMPSRAGIPSPLRVAMIGQKGLPATFGGVERHVEEVGARLAAFGHQVTVYCRANYGGTGIDTYRGMRLCPLPTVGTKHLDAVAHSAYATMWALRQRPDIVHYHALGPGLIAPLPRFLSGARVVLTVHGLDNERDKWGRAARAVLGVAHWMSARVPDATVVVSHALARHYAERFGRPTTYVPNGVDITPSRRAGAVVTRYGLQPGSYLLFVGRLVPEKAPDLLVRAYRHVPGDRRLVIVGDSSFTSGYVTELHRLAQADPRVVFTGYLYGEDLSELYSNAAAFVLPSSVEGMPLTLLEAIAHGLPVVASDIDPHREVCDRDGPGHRLFRTGDERSLVHALDRALLAGERERAGARELRARFRNEYRWEVAARRLEALYLRLLQGVPGTGEPAASPAERAGTGREPPDPAGRSSGWSDARPSG